MAERDTQNAAGTHVDDVVIRRAEEADAAAIGALWEQLVEYHHRLDDKLPTAAHEGGKLYARRIEERLDDNYTRVLIAESDGQVVGFVLGVIVDMVPEMFAESTGGFLADIFVDETYRRQGIGWALVEALADWFRSRGVTHFEWYVAAHNLDGRAFWQAVGGRDVMVRMRAEL